MDNLLLGLQVAVTFDNLTFCLFGVFIGTLMGALPGIGALAAVAMLMPLSFHLEPTTALIMLAGIYYGSEYGGSIASILLNLPGGPSSAVTCIDGHPMAKKGKAGVALFITTIASFIAGTFGTLLLAVLTPLVVAVALAFGPEEYCVIMLLGLIAAGTIARGSPFKGIAMIVVGLLVGTIGADVNSGLLRFDLGIPELQEGISVVILAMGLFGVSEVINSVRTYRQSQGTVRPVTLREMWPNREEVRRSVGPIVRGTGLGSLLGPLPGTGLTISSFMSYAIEKRVSKTPHLFGTGQVEGIAAPEAANNAAAQTAFIPTLSLGIPGSATMAIMIGAMMVHGITPGPLLISQHADLFWGVVVSFWIGNLLLLILNIPFIGLWVTILRIPYPLLYPIIVALICVGVLSVTNNPVDVLLVLAIGFGGYILNVLDFEPAPLLMGYILGPVIEENLRRSMLISGGDPLVFIQRPISGSILAAGAVIIGFILWLNHRRRRNGKLQLSESAAE